MQKPELVATDVDGTLVDRTERVSARTLRAVAGVVASSTPFVLVTGRPPRWVPRIAEALGVAGLAVCANGAVHYDTRTDRVLHRAEISPACLREVMRELRQAIPGCSFGVERVTCGALDRIDQQFLAEDGFRLAWPNRDIRQAAVEELAGHPAVKLLVLHPDSTSVEMATAAEATIGGLLGLTYSTSAGLIELTVLGADKAAGLASVVREHEIARADVIAFGDMPNDIPMLDWVGHGVAMRNGHPDVLEIADEVTASNLDDGVAQVLERWW